MGHWFIVYHDGDIINDFRFHKWVRDYFQFAPHVVINNKLHVSFGNRSFSYDTDNHVWEISHLFDTFWVKNYISPSNFCGGSVWGDYSRINVAGQPFGFQGRGILCDNNDILLGVHYAPDCALIAFKLENGIAVDFQRFTLDLGLDASDDRFGLNGMNWLSLGASIVDLGRDGYFSLVHFVYDHNKMHTFIPSEHFCMELVTFKVSRTTSADGFLKCQFVRKDTVCGDNIQRDVYDNYQAFSLY